MTWLPLSQNRWESVGEPVRDRARHTASVGGHLLGPQIAVIAVIEASYFGEAIWLVLRASTTDPISRSAVAMSVSVVFSSAPAASAACPSRVAAMSAWIFAVAASAACAWPASRAAAYSFIFAVMALVAAVTNCLLVAQTCLVLVATSTAVVAVVAEADVLATGVPALTVSVVGWLPQAEQIPTVAITAIATVV